MSNIVLATTDDRLLEWVETFSGGYELEEILSGEFPLPDFPGLYIVKVSNRRYIGKGCAVDEEKIAYIGISTKSIRRRWENHHKMPIIKSLHELGIYVVIQTKTFLPGMIEDKDLFRIEQQLIAKIKPFLNRLS